MLKIGSLCSGYGGLDMAVEAYFNAETVWMCDNDKYASVVIKERWDLPNLGDLKTVDWSTVEPIDILTAGYPCQPFSTAGNRKGENDSRHIWPNINQAIGILRPRFVILENVRGHLSLGFKEVLKDLAIIGYDTKWQTIRASDVGAPHRRERLFAVATLQRTNTDSERFALGENNSRTERNQGQSQFIVGELGQAIADTSSKRLQRSLNKRYLYAKCSDIWDRLLPNPLAENRLNPKFVEYMMGLPEGWVTDLDISRSQQLKILGNGVVPQQAYYALQLLCDTPIIERKEQINLTEALC
jgi:DNA (cytosine-5)-methyltransferase 1